jgi:hypothetical protein
MARMLVLLLDRQFTSVLFAIKIQSVQDLGGIASETFTIKATRGRFIGRTPKFRNCGEPWGTRKEL